MKSVSKQGLLVSLFALGIAATFACTTAADAGGEAPPALIIRVSDVRVATGMVHVDVCTATTFLKSCATSGAAPAALGITSVVIHNLKPGVYGAQIFHDKNANGKVDRALFGIPTEGVGFSNDAPIRLGPPSFGDAAFTYRGGVQTIDIKLRYF